jgi:hypothetical protein
LSAGAITSGDHLGVRAQIDLLAGRRWYVGLAGGWRETDGQDTQHSGTGQARLVVGAHRSFGRFTLRAQLGLGADVSRRSHDRMDGRDPMSDVHGANVVPIGEAAVLAHVPLTDTWGLIGGPVIEAALADHGLATVSVFLGIQRGL